MLPSVLSPVWKQPCSVSTLRAVLSTVSAQAISFEFDLLVASLTATYHLASFLTLYHLRMPGPTLRAGRPLCDLLFAINLKTTDNYNIIEINRENRKTLFLPPFVAKQIKADTNIRL